jgi:hypothetical protein
MNLTAAVVFFFYCGKRVSLTKGYQQRQLFFSSSADGKHVFFVK